MSNSSIETLASQLPSFVYDVLEMFWRNGIETILVGGACRDFFEQGKIGRDLDFEIQSQIDCSLMEWEQKLRMLSKELKSKYGNDCELNSFGIISLDLKSHNLEFAPARSEHFDGLESIKGHSDVNVTLVPKINLLNSFQRRDFTINCIAVRIAGSSQCSIEDPFHGINHLAQKMIESVGQNFHLDPVRLLRAIRFRQKINGHFGPVIQTQFERFDCRRLSIHYFKYEAFKGNAWAFTRELMEITQRFKIAMPVWSDKLIVIARLEIEKKRPRVKNEKELLSLLMLFDGSDAVGQLGECFNLPKKFIQQWRDIKICLAKVDVADPRLLEEINHVHQARPLCLDKVDHLNVLLRMVRIWSELKKQELSSEVYLQWKLAHPSLYTIDNWSERFKLLSSSLMPDHVPAAQRSLYQLSQIILGKH